MNDTGGNNDGEIRSIERTFYRIDDGETDFPTCSVAIEISGIGSWIVKFSVNGIVVNNCDIVFAIEPNDCSARIQFKSLRYPPAQLISHLSIHAIYLSMPSIDLSMHHLLIYLFYCYLSEITTYLLISYYYLSFQFLFIYFLVYCVCSAFWTVLNGGERYQDGVSKGNITETGLPIAIELIKRKMFHAVDVSADNINRMESLNGHNVPIKSGWLLKKRDFIFGWQCRYFVVYVGRVEYYIDQHDQHPKGVIQLFGAEITTASKCSVNGVNDHWSISIEPRNRERAFRLASELTGEEGMVDATSWVQVFMTAARPADSASGLHGSLPLPRSVNPSDVVDSSITSRGTVPTLPGKSVLRDKERTIRKNTDLVPTAVVISIFSVIIGWLVGNGVQVYIPSTSLVSTFGVILFTACICFLSSYFLGLFDYRWTHLFFNVNNNSSNSSSGVSNSSSTYNSASGGTSGNSSSSGGRAIRRPLSEYSNSTHYPSPHAGNKHSSVTGADSAVRVNPMAVRRERNGPVQS